MVLGLSTAMETLCGQVWGEGIKCGRMGWEAGEVDGIHTFPTPRPQAYGARDYKALGEVLQRALLVCWVACIPVALLWSQSTALMVAVGQDPAIAAMAGRYGESDVSATSICVN